MHTQYNKHQCTHSTTNANAHTVQQTPMHTQYNKYTHLQRSCIIQCKVHYVKMHKSDVRVSIVHLRFQISMVWCFMAGFGSLRLSRVTWRHACQSFETLRDISVWYNQTVYSAHNTTKLCDISVLLWHHVSVFLRPSSGQRTYVKGKVTRTVCYGIQYYLQGAGESN